MDITRNWRLKTSRSQLMATRDPQTGAVILPGQTPPREVAIYTFDLDGVERVTARATEDPLAEAAR